MLKAEIDTIMAACTIKFFGMVDIVGHRGAYAFRCVQCEYSMRYSEQFLGDCYRLCRESGQKFWQEYFEKHLEEEKGHHAWALNDLEQVRDIVGALPVVSDEIKALLLHQRSKIDGGEFLPQVGYCISVEGYQGNKRTWKSFAESASLPISAFKNATRHAVIDREHIRELWQIYDRCSKREQDVVGASARFTAIQQYRSISRFRPNEVAVV